MWGTVPEIRSDALGLVYQKSRSYDVCFLRNGVWQRYFFVILCLFLPFYPITNLKNQNFEKMKHKPRDIIILHLCTTNDNHMMNGSWDMECDRHYFFSCWTIFCPFTCLTIQKINILKKNENVGVPKIMIRCSVPEMWGATDGQTEKRTDGRKKWHIEVGAPPKNKLIDQFSSLSRSDH